MKTVLSIASLLLWLATSTASAQVQDADLLKAMQHYRGVYTARAMVTRTQHNVLLADDEVTQGVLYVKAPDKVCMTFRAGEDRMLMNGKLFAISSGGKTNAAVGRIQTQFEGFFRVFMHVFLGKEPSLDISSIADVQIQKQAGRCTITVTPVEETTAKGKKKASLFASAVFTVDLKTGEFRSFRMNEKGDNYTLYTFTEFSLGGTISDSQFEL